ncbi:hypothetical protein M5D96_009552 [Drosophila gunungcola]|uniref:Sulfatase N-terminal domain-containing protein n=1 Tax=Drosophila gunungcola TaxID=103775 RepID=A0A9Q0BMM0_9MUSC|nr:hypothetical protein M5D96_009552 [Drosophila gunungcola]
MVGLTPLIALILACLGNVAIAKLPNILLILSDDQDVELRGMFPMEQTIQLLGYGGALFHNAFTPTPICCPARTSLLTGMRALEPRALPHILQQNGYNTFFGGKYLNEYWGAGDVPKGWNQFYGLHGNSRYYNYTLRENSGNVHYESTYLTDLLRDRAVDFLRNATQSQGAGEGQPFFAMVAPPAAHAPFTPAPRHEGVFSHIKALRTPSFNETIDTIDKYFQKRWESLLAVDELVATLVGVLNETQSLDNTYVVYTSDNGYHVGQFAQPFDKRQPYETDIGIPLLIRGPGIAPESHVDTAVSLVDLAPTILAWANVSTPAYMDGQSFHEILLSKERRIPFFERSLLIEYWGEGNVATYNPECPWAEQDRLAQCSPEAECHCQDSWNNTYACLRNIRHREDRVYCEFRDNENYLEAYDLQLDQFQMTNIAYDLLPIERALYSLRLRNLTQCSGHSCSL